MSKLQTRIPFLPPSVTLSWLPAARICPGARCVCVCVSSVLVHAVPKPSPKLAEKLMPPARPGLSLTEGKGCCTRAERPRLPPPARCMARRLLPGELACSRLPRRAGGRLSLGPSGPVPAAHAAWPAKPGPPRAPLRGQPGPRLGPGQSCALRLRLPGHSTDLWRNPPRAGPPPPPLKVPPGARAFPPPSRSSPSLPCPARRQGSPWYLGPCPQPAQPRV